LFRQFAVSLLIKFVEPRPAVYRHGACVTTVVPFLERLNVLTYIAIKHVIVIAAVEKVLDLAGIMPATHQRVSDGGGTSLDLGLAGVRGVTTTPGIGHVVLVSVIRSLRYVLVTVPQGSVPSVASRGQPKSRSVKSHSRPVGIYHVGSLLQSCEGGAVLWSLEVLGDVPLQRVQHPMLDLERATVLEHAIPVERIIHVIVPHGLTPC
jgi:hypothetical protein